MIKAFKDRKEERQTDEDIKEFWKEKGQTGVGEERKINISLNVYTDGGAISRDITTVLNKWRDDFKVY